MEVRVGKIYKCGQMKVKILHLEPKHSEGGHCWENMSRSLLVGATLDEDNDIDGESLLGFWNSVGKGCHDNPKAIKHHLEEIEDTKEMTVSQINEALGYEIKVVKGD